MTKSFAWTMARSELSLRRNASDKWTDQFLLCEELHRSCGLVLDEDARGTL